MRIIVTFLFVLYAAQPAHSLTLQQEKGMYRHGIWEWALQNCPGTYRNKGYWFALKEVGEFENTAQIRRNETGKSFIEGREYMESNARKFGIGKTCDYAIEQWPAVLVMRRVTRNKRRIARV